MWARLQLGAGMFYGSSAVLSVVSALRGRRATWRWNELMGPSTMRGLGVLDTVAAKPVPRRGAQRRERASKRRKFMPKTACRKVKNSRAQTGHQRGMGGRGTDDDDTHERHTDTNKLTRHTASWLPHTLSWRTVHITPGHILPVAPQGLQGAKRTNKGTTTQQTNRK